MSVEWHGKLFIILILFDVFYSGPPYTMKIANTGSEWKKKQRTIQENSREHGKEINTMMIKIEQEAKQTKQ